MLPMPPVLDACAKYVLVDHDLGGLPLQEGEMFRARITDDEGEYHSISGFRAPCDLIDKLVMKFLDAAGGGGRVLSVEQWSDSCNGLHPIP